MTVRGVARPFDNDIGRGMARIRGPQNIADGDANKLFDRCFHSRKVLAERRILTGWQGGLGTSE